MPMSNYFRNKLVDWAMRGQTFAPPGILYVALCTSAPTAAALGTEVSVSGYTRAAITSSLADWSGTQGSGTSTASSGTTGAVTNNIDIIFGTPTADVPSPVGYFMIMDASSSGNMLYYGTIVNGGGTPTPRTISSGDGLSFVAGSLKIQLT